ncbi:MAG TPA: D-aminoacyl-tRNA deacylase [Fimbriimonadaceae bacterium]|nr:D-aminoacyl-tRNA deacylase [Fimbriimonadaceae bacterium]HRJ96597.1 D-aminoacyl-tRNA deacylase [Fimbriimonadaceae bacterium]
MRAIVQRVTSASVTVEGQVVGRCGPGLVVLAAAHRNDDESNAVKLADRVHGLRVFADAEGKMNLGLADFPPTDEPRVLAISNFTLYGDCAKSRRPSFVDAAPYEQGERLFFRFVEALRGHGVEVATGVFGAMMLVIIENDGPVTLLVDV